MNVLEFLTATSEDSSPAVNAPTTMPIYSVTLNPVAVVLKAVFGTASNVILIASAGAYLFYKGVTNEKINSTLSKIIMNLYLPCLLFSFFIKSFNVYDVYTWLPISVFCLAHTSVGFLIGYLVEKYFLKQPKMWALILL